MCIASFVLADGGMSAKRVRCFVRMCTV